ncbi:hypothetical protein, variant 1 [Saprolegnia diclina VS20]|uniref:Uncharacterized protein n=2 Tax=Saprolegnia diclina (strain VS20) TaxID=1156394 RepID=T0RR86_SAPDV|nr:hypothetical protein SDRG_09914 [Saprolegnia diclina VS20]XP_008614099.1 hypothetical protein, variant 1 [Saprolegnia diclina VS20]EQC32597.1 hypothetical protein SDRG_09914 [Saprolegnia diclina VS20]EQC32598.1 hypothetical protein, variant 1 [Saprolegnia diclina VS20]|eukprot:XP_008614098.1 hypothetical protein SDRG_09914 [Saprolegnia diclina VS20]
MGNDQSQDRSSRQASTRGSALRMDHYPGVPFVVWDGEHHFAEPSSYKYSGTGSQVLGQPVFVNPPKADTELRNVAELSGNIAVVERGGRVHFPDIMRRLLKAGITGCVFVEREEYKGPSMLFEGFHSSGRQTVDIPIVRLSKFHADQFLRKKPAQIAFAFVSGSAALEKLVGDDLPSAASTACRLGEGLILRSLLQTCSPQSIETTAWANALCDAAENGHVDCIEALHAVGVSLDDHKPNGTTPLMVACSAGNVEVARALVTFGASIDAEDVHDNSALMIAARDGAEACVRYLIRKGACINLSRNRKRGTTALHMAARSGKDDCLVALIEAHADLDIPSPSSTTALMEAARAGHLSIVKTLADAGAQLDCKDRDGKNAEAIATAAGFQEIEDFLRQRAESDSVKDQRKQIEDAINQPEFTLRALLELADEAGIDVDILKREVLRNPKIMRWLTTPNVVFDIFKHLTAPPSMNLDPVYGAYKMQHFCCEIALWYDRKIFERQGAVDADVCVAYFKVLFNFLCKSGSLDDVLVVLFCKVVNTYVNDRGLGPSILLFFSREASHIVPWVVCHVGLDSIRDSLVWILYSDLSETGQLHLAESGLFGCMLDRLCSWQRTLSWGVGTAYQRDSVENICALLKYILFPPSVYVIGNVATFVENTDFTLPLITDRSPAGRQNELLRSLLAHLVMTETVFAVFLSLGLAELSRQIKLPCAYVLQDGGALSVLLMLMSTLGYHKKKRDVASVEGLLRDCQKALVDVVVPRVGRFVHLCHDVVTRKTAAPRGNALLCVVTFLKRCIFMQHGVLNAALAQAGCMPALMACFAASPSNSMLHHEVTDVIRFVLLDPDQKRLPSCPLLNSLFLPSSSILELVITSYHGHVQYKGHMTTIANSIFTLINTPVQKDQAGVTCQEVVRQYTATNEAWVRFEAVVGRQNSVEMAPLGQRHAPLCSGCVNLKETAAQYVTETLGSHVYMSGYVETIFSGAATHHCKVNTTEDFITGFLYKKDKIHDHIPVPEPTRASSFIQFPVPMPFHALTFTLTFVGLCRKCDKLWYCDTLQSGTANWTTRMKWVIPTSVRKWYSFGGAAAGPGSGAHGLVFSTKGYKNFLVLTDTWGRQEQWIHAIEDAVIGLQSRAQVQSSANALAIEIDNEADNSNIMTSQDVRPVVSPPRKRSNTTTSTKTTGELDLKMFQRGCQVDNLAKAKGLRLPPRFQTDPNETPLMSLKALGKDNKIGMRHVASTPNLASFAKSSH